jgi:hypothetical protein
LEEFTDGEHIDGSDVSIAFSQVNDCIDFSLGVAAVFKEDFHEFSVYLTIEAEILYFVIFVDFDIWVREVCWVDFCELKPFRTQIVDNLLEMTEHEEVRVVFDQDLDELKSKVKLIGNHVKGLEEEFEEVRISCKSFS